MADDQEKLTIAISAVDNASAVLKELSGNVSDASDKIATGNQKAGFSFTELNQGLELAEKAYRAVENVITPFVDAALESSRVTAQLEVNVKNAGLSYSELAPKIEEVAKQNEMLGFSNDETQASLGKSILATGNYNDALKLNNLAMDLAASKHISLSDATIALNQVMTGSFKVLKQYGISLDSATTSADALNTVQGLVGGSAEKLAGTPAGAIRAMQAQWDGIKDEVGAKLMPVITDLFNVFEQNLPMIENDLVAGATAVSKLAEATIQATPYIIDLGSAFVAYFVTIKAIAAYSAIEDAIIGLQFALSFATSASEALTLAMGALDIAMDANPVGVFAGAIAIAAGAVAGFVQWLNKAKDAAEKEQKQSDEHVANLKVLSEAYNKVHQDSQVSVLDLMAQGYQSDKLTEATTDLEKEYNDLSNQLKNGTMSQKDFDEKSKDIVSTLNDLGIKIGAATSNFDAFGNKVQKVNTSSESSAEDHANAVTKLKTTYDKLQSDATSDLNDLADEWTDKAKTIKDTIKSMQDKMDELTTSYNNTRASDTSSVADEIVSSEQKIADIKSQLTKATTSDEIESLNEKLAVEQANYDSSLAFRQANADAMAAAEAKAKETDLQRTIDTYNEKEKADTDAYNKEMANQKSQFDDYILKSTQEVLRAQIKVLTIQVAETLAHNEYIKQSGLREKQTTDEVNSEIEDYNRLADAIAKVQSAKGSVATSSASSYVYSSHESGGYVNAPRGTAVPIMAHGGEQIIPAEQVSNNNGGNVTVVIQNPTVRRNSDLDDIKSAVEQVFRSVLINNKVAHT